MNIRSISFRLVAWHAGLLAGIFILLCALLYINLRIFLEHDMSQAQLRRAHQIANTLLVHVSETGEAYAAAQTKDWFEPEINDRFIRITRNDGIVVYMSGAPKDNSFDPADVPVFPHSTKVETSKKIKLADGKTLLISRLELKTSNKASYAIEFGALLDPVDSMLQHLFLQLALGLPIAILIIIVGGYWLVRRALTPVQKITRAAESITQHNLSERLPISHSGDELEELSLSLNLMISRLEDAFQNSKRFVADASHELRTPLTVFRGELESFAGDPRLDAELRDRAISMLEEAVHLSKIVENLFTMSRLDSGEARSSWARFDLAELAKSTVDQMSLLAEDRQISLRCETYGMMPVEGDRARLKQVIVNLLDNAIKYTPKNGEIQLRVHAVNGHVIMEVEDNGIGIPTHALPHVFERFYRVNPTDGDSAGAGLGLSIVKSICSAHGGEIETESHVGKGSCFRIKLPSPKK